MKTTKKVTSTRSSQPMFRLKASFIAIAACFMPLVYANPVGPVVVSGGATIANQGNTLTVTNTPGAILNWQQFNISKGQTTQFNQQSAQSSVLNRVVGVDPSQILGTLRSNGNVFLINPNGIMFGAGSILDVNRLVASTLNITNADFLANNLKFNSGSGASILNQGQITTPMGGSVYLIGNDVTNQGVITTPGGQVVLAAGSSVSLVDAFTPNVSVTVSAPAGGQALNLGTVSAAGGSIDIYAALVKQQGVVSANSASLDAAGNVVLSATQAVEVAAGSSTSAANSAGKGGSVQILAPQVSVAGAVDASGVTGGGSILVGGDYQGKNAAVANALDTRVASSASLTADATGNGDGGKVIVWADNSTQVLGSISAQGGALGGNGGLIETSGHYLDVTGISINAKAPKGLAGTWLLDPIDVSISMSPATEIGGTFISGTWTPTAPGSTIFNTTIQAALNAGTNVTITTANAALEQGNITVNAPIAATGTVSTTLTLQAENSIFLNSSISSSGSALNLVLNTRNGQTDLGGVTVSLGGGSLSALASASSSGIVSMANAGNFFMNGGFSATTLNVSAGQVRVDSATALTNLNISGGTFNVLSGTSTVQDFIMTGGTLIGAGTVDVTNSFSQTSSNLLLPSSINKTGTLSVNHNTGTLTAGDITSGTLMLGAPALNLTGNLLATEISLYADGPITVAAGKTVKSTNGAASNPSGTIFFGNYNPGAVVVGTSGLVDGASISSLAAGTGTYQASGADFSSDTSLTVNSAPVGLDLINLSSPTITINGNVQAKEIGLYTDNAITVGTGVSVLATNGAATNPMGVLSFGNYTASTTPSPRDMALGGGWLDVTKISNYGGTGVLQTSKLAIFGDSTLTVNTPFTWSGPLTLNAPNITIASGGAVNVVGAGNIDFWASAGLTNSGTLSGSGILHVGSASAGFTNHGTLNPGGVGVTDALTVQGDATLGSTSIVNMELAGTGTGSVSTGPQFDRLLINGAFAMAGTLNSSVLTGYTPGNADTNVLITSTTTPTGSFSAVNLPSIPGYHAAYNQVTGEALRLIYSGGTISFTNGSGDSSWVNPLNWSSGFIPESFNDVVIGGSSFSVLHASGTDNISKLTINGANTLNVSGGSLSASGATTLDGILQVSSVGNLFLNAAVTGGTANQIIVSGGNLSLNGTTSISSLSLTGGTLNGSGTVSVNTSYSQTLGNINKTGSLSINQASGNLVLGSINAGAISLTSAGDINIGNSSVTSTGSLTVIANNLNLTANTAATQLRGVDTIINLTGGLNLSAGTSGTGIGATLRSTGNQDISVGAGGIHMTAGGGASTDADNAAQIIQSGTAGTHQTITVNGGGAVVMQGGSTGATNVGVGHGSRALIQADGDSQLIDFKAGGLIDLTGGSAGSRAYAGIYTLSGTQTIQGLPSIKLTGGLGGGVLNEGNQAYIQSSNTQTIAASGITLAGGGAGIDNRAVIFSAGNQNISIGTAGLTATGGGLGFGTGSGNNAGIFTNGTNQTITTGSVNLTGGTHGIGNAAYIQGATQNITITGNLALNGGGSSSGANSLGGAQIGGIFGGVGVGTATNLTLSVSGNLALTAGSANGAALGSINTGGQRTDISATVGGGITLDPGTAGTQNTLIGSLPGSVAIGNISLTATGSISLGNNAGVLSLGNVSLTAGSILQSTASMVKADLLTTQTATGLQLVGSGNLFARYSGNNTSTGSMLVTNTGPLAVQSINNAGGNVTFSNTGGALSLGTGNVNGNLTATSNGWAITQAAGGLVAGFTTTINAGAAAITLTDAANDFVRLVLNNTGANNVQIRDANDLLLVGGAYGGNLAVTAGGAYTQSGSLSVTGAANLTAGTLTLGSITAGSLGLTSTGSIHIANSSVTSTGAVTLTGANLVMASTTGKSFLKGASMDVTMSGNISLSAGGIGSYSSAEIFSTGNQTITANGITLMGGAAGGVQIQTDGTVLPASIPGSSVPGNYAGFFSGANQTINVGAGGLVMTGGGRFSAANETGNYVSIYQKGLAGTSQSINVTGGGQVTLQGGSSQGSSLLTSDGSFALIRADGDSQSINFSAGGALNILGGAVGSNNQAFIKALSGSQTVSGSANITLTGGASGGADGHGNFAGLFTDGALQTINASGMTLNAGAGGIANPAFVQAPTQNITITGNLALNGGGSAASATSGGGVNVGARGGATATATNLNLNVSGNVLMTGGSVSGAGVSIGQSSTNTAATNITMTIGGNLTMNPGSAAGVGSRIGSSATSAAGGNISITAVGNIALNDDSVIRTLGNVSLSSANITQTAASQLVGAGLTATTASGMALLSTANELGWINASNTGTGNIELVSTNAVTYTTNPAAPTASIATYALLDVKRLSNTGGNIMLTNFGGISTSGLVSAGGSLAMTANSPLTIGAAGVSAGSNVTLTTTNQTSAGNMTLNGPVSSTAGSAAFTAAGNYVQNSAVKAASSVSTSAGGSVTFGTAATTDARTVSYMAAGATVTAPPSAVKITVDPCLTNPALCTNTTTTTVTTPADTTVAPVATPDSTEAAPSTGKIVYVPATVAATPAVVVTYKEIVVARVEARQADVIAQQAQDNIALAATPEAKVIAVEQAVVKSTEADSKRADAKIKEAETELRAAEVEVKTTRSTPEKVRAESRKSVAETKRADGEVDKATAESKAAEIEVKRAKTPEARAAAETKLSQAKAKKAEADVKKAEVEVKKAETEVRQAEAEAKTSNDPQAKAAVEAKKAEVESKKAEVEVKKAHAELETAKAPAEKAKAEEKVAVAEVKKADTEARKADVEARHAQDKAKNSDSPVEKQTAVVKKADAEVKKAEVEVKKAELEVKTAKTPEAKQKAEEKHAQAEAKKADHEVAKAESEVKQAEAIASNSSHPKAKQDVENKKAEAEVKKADAEVKKANAEVKAAKAPREKEAAEDKHHSAEVKKAEAELKQAEHEAKQNQDEARGPQSAYLRNSVSKKAEASVAKLEAKKAELEVKKVMAEVKQAEREVSAAKTPEARAQAEQRLQAKRAQVQDKEQKVASLRAEADSKDAEAKVAKRSSDNKIVEVFGGMSLATMAKAQINEAMAARHEFMKESLSPALSVLQANPKAADLKPCGAGGGDVCVRPMNPALTNMAATILPRIQLAVKTPSISFLPTIQRKVAVVIGNNAYQDANIPSLDGAIKDADAIGNIFKDKMGYDVRMVHNGTRADIVRTLNQVSDETGSNDSVVVYYAGHGYQMEDTKVGYWIPSDASVKDPSNWISNSDINKILTTIPAKQMMVMSDSCYSGALTNEQRVTAGVASGNVQEILGKRSVLVMSSGGEEPVLDEGREGHSIFAWHLMDKLNNVAQFKNGFEVFDAVKTSVAQENIPQTPQYGASTSAGHTSGGEYLFEVRKY